MNHFLKIFLEHWPIYAFCLAALVWVALLPTALGYTTTSVLVAAKYGTLLGALSALIHTVVETTGPDESTPSNSTDF